jgi:hypothetical protein
VQTRCGRTSWPGERPEVRINQLRYLPSGPKRAVWASDMRGPAAFRVRDCGGAEVLRGRTQPWPVPGWAAIELWLATGDAAYAEKARLALLRDVLDLDGFDWNRMVAPAALDLALHGEAFDGQTACSRAWPACRRSAATSTSPRQRRRTTSASAGARRSSGWPPFSADELAADTPRGTCASSGDVDLGRPGRGGASRTPVGGDPPPIGRWGPWSPDLGAANLRASPNDGLPTEVLPCPTCPRLSTPSTF